MLYYIHEPATTIQRSLTLDDYLQLQMLLRHEQAARERRLNHHHPVSMQQLARLQYAMDNLKRLKENYRRERAYRIQRYMDHYRQQALVAAMQDEFYRQCLAAAIEQQRADALWREYQQKVREQEQEHEDFENFHAQQLAGLLRLLFGDPDALAPQNQVEIVHRPMDDVEQDAMDLWNYVSQQQKVPDSMTYYDEQEEEPEEEEEDEEEEDDDEETPTPKQLPLTADNNNVMSALGQKKPEPVREPVKRSMEEEDTEEMPPLQDRVLNLKDLLNELVAAGGGGGGPAAKYEEPKASGMKQPSEQKENKMLWGNDESAAKPSVTAEPPPRSTTTNVLQEQTRTETPEEEQLTFEPKQVVTMAEPYDSVPSPDPVRTQKEAERVHRIAEQQKKNSPVVDPVKLQRHRQLEEIAQQLREIRQNREAAVLAAPLQFTPSDQGTLHLTATTPNNRGFLGYEDEIMRAMLKLDAIESEGDEDIRNERRNLVKEAESMLERLDQHKQREWEKTRKNQNNGRATSRKKKHKHRRRHHRPQQAQPVGVPIG